MSCLTHSGPVPVVRADDGALYSLPLLLAAYRAGWLIPGSAAERCARWHLMTAPPEPQRQIN